jgi:hypothetical protein
MEESSDARTPNPMDDRCSGCDVGWWLWETRHKKGRESPSEKQGIT